MFDIAKQINQHFTTAFSVAVSFCIKEAINCSFHYFWGKNIEDYFKMNFA